MAWGYWSATAVDRGRSPRRNTQLPQNQYHAQGYQQPPQQHQPQPVPQQQPQPQQQQYTLANSHSQQPSMHCSVLSLNTCPQSVELPPALSQQQLICSNGSQPQLHQQHHQQQQQQQPQMCSSPCHSPCHSPQFIEQLPPELPCTPCTFSRRQSLDSPQANQLSDIICRATQPSIQSAGNTLTRGTSLRDTGDYAVPHPHPHTHHYMSTSATPPSLSRVGSCPGSTGGSGSGHGSGSGSSPGGGPGSGGGGSGSVGGSGMGGVGFCSGSILGGSQGRLEYIECSHYDRMPLPIPVQIPIVPPPQQQQLHSEDEIEPAYATEPKWNH
uniref:Uncharacterized protein n=1 Tax=Anopheles albimanus TaxID=7167 RepID=A0A182FVS5_ANOAL